MTTDDVIASLNVIRYYNPNMTDLYTHLSNEAPIMDHTRFMVDKADEDGLPIYETLVVNQVALANAVHDYIYNIVHPLDSVVVKNIIREQMCRDIFGLEASF